MRYAIILLVLAFSPQAFATVRTAASASRTDVLNAYTLCANGDILEIPAGTSNTYSTPITIAKLIEIRGAGVGSTVLGNTSSASQGLEVPIFDVSISSGQVIIHDIRFTSPTFDVNDGVRSANLGGTLIIYNCQFDRFSFGLKILTGFGLCYNTLFLNNDVHSRQAGSNSISAFSGFSGGNPPWGWDSQNYFVFEDCTFTRQSWVQDTYSIDTEYPANYMVRHCTFNEHTASQVGLDGLDMHGVNGVVPNVPLGIVVYNNQWIYSGSSTVSPSKIYDVRGGAYSLVFNNTSSGPGTWLAYGYLRADPSPTVKMTNTHVYNNSAEAGVYGPSVGNGLVLGTNYFTSAPAPLTLLAYPHPLRGAVTPTFGPYYVSTTGNDSNAGTEASPFLTIAKATSVMVPGDTTYIRNGTYTGTGNVIAPTVSGSAAAPITYRAYTGEQPVISNRQDAITLTNVDYIVIDGIDVSSVDELFTINSGDHNIIRNCDIGQMRNFDRWAGGQIYNSSQYNQILNCTIHTWGTAAGGSDDGAVLEIGEELDSDNSDQTAFNVVDGCRMYDGGHHIIGLHGHQNVLKNSYLSNDQWSGGYGNRVVYLLGYANANYRCLVENNRIAWASPASDQPGEGQAGILVASPNHIIRKNAIFRNDASGLYDSFSSGYPTEGDGVKIYNNTFYANGLSPGTGFSNCISLADWENIVGRFISGVAIKNNLFAGNGSNSVQYYNTTAGDNTEAQNFNQTVSGDPLFTDTATGQTAANGLTFPNLILSTGSPAIDYAGALTTITSSTGSGTSFTVADASYFCDGWGVQQGDTIRLVGTSVTATISAVNYTTNVITVSPSISWTNGVGVALNYNGSNPDAGAFETATTAQIPLMTGLSFQAEDGLVVAPFSVSSGAISQAIETPVVANGGLAQYRVTIPATGNYSMTMAINAPDSGSNSLFIDWDQEPVTPTAIWDSETTAGIQSQAVSWRGAGGFDTPQFDPKTWTLTAGVHTLYIRGREAGMQFDTITVVPIDTTAPIPDPLTWASVPALAGFSVNMTAATATDVLSGPVVYDFDETTGNTGGTDSIGQSSPAYQDTGLSPNTTYTYRVRARDSLGNATAYSGSQSVTTPPVVGPIDTINATNLIIGANSGSDIDLTGFTLTFSDEFDTLSVTETNPKGAAKWYWYPPYGASGGYSDSYWTTSGTMSVSGGILTNTAYWHTGLSHWVSGCLSSMDGTGAGFAQQYGYFSARVKMPNAGQGTWPQFWVFGTDAIADGNTGQRLELDIFEWYGVTHSNAQDVLQSQHEWNGDGSQGAGSGGTWGHVPGGDPVNTWHIYGLLIESDFITWYIDGVQTFQRTTPTTYHTDPMFVMIDYALGGGWALTGEPFASHGPSSMLVDWVRVYSLP